MVHLQKFAPPPAVKEVQPRRQDTLRDWTQFFAMDMLQVWDQRIHPTTSSSLLKNGIIGHPPSSLVLQSCGLVCCHPHTCKIGLYVVGLLRKKRVKSSTSALFVLNAWKKLREPFINNNSIWRIFYAKGYPLICMQLLIAIEVAWILQVFEKTC